MSLDDTAHRDEVSRAMGRLLLQSYALLDEYCEDCKGPLMRDPKNNLLCVSCQISSAKKPRRETINENETSNSMRVNSAEIESSNQVNQINSQLDTCQGLLMSKLTKNCQKLSVSVNNVEDEQLLNQIHLILDGLTKLRQLRSQ